MVKIDSDDGDNMTMVMIKIATTIIKMVAIIMTMARCSSYLQHLSQEKIRSLWFTMVMKLTPTMMMMMMMTLVIIMANQGNESGIQSAASCQGMTPSERLIWLV